MADKKSLFKILETIDGKPYQKYKEITGTYDMGKYTLHVDDVQSSSSSEHSKMRVTVSLTNSGFPDDTFSNKSRKVALADLIARRFWESSRADLKNVSVPRPGQEILERGSVVVAEKYIGIAFSFDLPSAGKNVGGKTATEMFKKLDAMVIGAVFYKSYKKSKLYNHIETSENADFIRQTLSEKGLVSFIGNGSVLPRREDGAAPMIDATEFKAPKKFEMTVNVPNGEPVIGMGIPSGLTVIAGPSGSGRSTLADAIYSGVFNHIPGDGREYVVTDDSAFYITKADGRRTNNIDVSSFARMKNAVTSENLTGPIVASVSMAEAAEVGCRLFLMDEDTCYPAILGTSDTLKSVISDEKIISISEIVKTSGSKISAIIAGNSENVFSNAGTVIAMALFNPSDVFVKVVKSSASEVSGERLPLVRNGAEFDINTTGIRFPTDFSYESSALNILKEMRERMDGSHTISSLSSANVTLSPKRVAVRPIDIAMMMNRLGAVSMIKRK